MSNLVVHTIGRMRYVDEAEARAKLTALREENERLRAAIQKAKDLHRMVYETLIDAAMHDASREAVRAFAEWLFWSEARINCPLDGQSHEDCVEAILSEYEKSLKEPR